MTGARAPGADVRFRPLVAGTASGPRRTGALDIQLGDRRVISVPSQLGCQVGCSFCISKDTPLARNLRAAEMLEMVRSCLEASPPDGRSIELSFTGEGEPLINWRECGIVARSVPALSVDFASVRYCFSGLGAVQLLERVETAPLPARLQFSLHAARQEVRDRLVARSAPLCDLLRALERHADRFTTIELNIVLQEGVNTSEADLRALASWGDRRWPIVLNPLLSDGREIVASSAARFQGELEAAGRIVKRYGQVAAAISRNGLYPQMTARRGLIIVSSQALPDAANAYVPPLSRSSSSTIDPHPSTLVRAARSVSASPGSQSTA